MLLWDQQEVGRFLHHCCFAVGLYMVLKLNFVYLATGFSLLFVTVSVIYSTDSSITPLELNFWNIDSISNFLDLAHIHSLDIQNFIKETF